jgi:hypothetical protein
MFVNFIKSTKMLKALSFIFLPEDPVFCTFSNIDNIINIRKKTLFLLFFLVHMYIDNALR